MPTQCPERTHLGINAWCGIIAGFSPLRTGAVSRFIVSMACEHLRRWKVGLVDSFRPEAIAHVPDTVRIVRSSEKQ